MATIPTNLVPQDHIACWSGRLRPPMAAATLRTSDPPPARFDLSGGFGHFSQRLGWLGCHHWESSCVMGWNSNGYVMSNAPSGRSVTNGFSIVTRIDERLHGPANISAGMPSSRTLNRFGGGGGGDDFGLPPSACSSSVVGGNCGFFDPIFRSFHLPAICANVRRGRWRTFRSFNTPSTDTPTRHMASASHQ